MPEISRFLGIVITMYWYDNIRHHIPHFHARYNEYECVFSIPELEILEGKLPTRITSYVIEWAKSHINELQEDWDLAVNDKLPKPINPLV